MVVVSLESSQTFRFLGFTISHELAILHCTKSFLRTPELLSTNKAFICSLMEYFSPIWTGSPASHLAQLDASEANAFKIIGLPRAEAEAMGLSLRHHRQVGGLSVFDCLLAGLVPSVRFVLCSPEVSAKLIRSTCESTHFW